MLLMIYGTRILIIKSISLFLNFNKILLKKILKVERTKTRPLASGELSTRQAFKFVFAHLFGGLCVLTQLNATTVALSFAIVPVFVFYPLAKRFTNYPQFILGIQIFWIKN